MRQEYCRDTKSNEYRVRMIVEVYVQAYSENEAEDIAKKELTKVSNVIKIHRAKEC